MKVNARAQLKTRTVIITLMMRNLSISMRMIRRRVIIMLRRTAASSVGHGVTLSTIFMWASHLSLAKPR